MAVPPAGPPIPPPPIVPPVPPVALPGAPSILNRRPRTEGTQFAGSQKDTFQRGNEVTFKGMTLSRHPQQAPQQVQVPPQNQPAPQNIPQQAPQVVQVQQPPVVPQNHPANDQVVPQQPTNPDALQFGCSKKSPFKI